MNEQILRKILVSLISFRDLLKEGNESANKEWVKIRDKIKGQLEVAASYPAHLATAFNSIVDTINEINGAVRDSKSSIKKICELLGINYKTVKKMLKKHKLQKVNDSNINLILPKIIKAISRSNSDIAVEVCNVIILAINVTLSVGENVVQLGQLWHTVSDLKEVEQVQTKKKKNNKNK